MAWCLTQVRDCFGWGWNIHIFFLVSFISKNTGDDWFKMLRDFFMISYRFPTPLCSLSLYTGSSGDTNLWQSYQYIYRMSGKIAGCLFLVFIFSYSCTRKSNNLLSICYIVKVIWPDGIVFMCLPVWIYEPLADTLWLLTINRKTGIIALVVLKHALQAVTKSEWIISNW